MAPLYYVFAEEDTDFPKQLNNCVFFLFRKKIKVAKSRMAFWFYCSWYVIRWFANLTKFRILKYEYLLLFTFSWEKESLIGQRFFVGPIRDLFSQLKKKRKQIFVLQNSKFCQISKSLEEIPRTLISFLVRALQCTESLFGRGSLCVLLCDFMVKNKVGH